jgi:zinc transporter, ZIP family
VAEAALWGLAAGSSLLLGALIALRLRPGRRVVGLLMAFGAGVLISAVAYDLVEEAFHVAEGSGAVGAGLAAGALAFYFGDRAIAARGGADRKNSEAEHADEAHRAIVLGTVLDGVPEGLVIGLSLIGGGEVSAAVIVAVFMSNLPEAIGASRGLERSGFSPGRLYRMWGAITVLTAVAAALGYELLADASGELVAFIEAFAGGALLTMVSATMLPEAVRGGGREVGLLTVLGFAVAFLLVQVG